MSLARLRALAAGSLDQHVESLADHAEKGGIWDKAVKYLQAAGAKAYSLYANSEAAGYFERALKALGQYRRAAPFSSRP